MPYDFPTRYDDSHLAQVRRDIARKDLPWQAGKTSFWNTSYEQLIDPADLAAPRQSSQVLPGVPVVKESPDSWDEPGRDADWGDRGGRSYLDPVASQARSFCLAYGVGAVVGAQARIATGTIDGSPLLTAGSLEPLVAWAQSAGGGGTVAQALAFCRVYGLGSGPTVRVAAQAKFDRSQTRGMKAWLTHRGPLIATMMMPATLDLLHYVGGVYEPTTDECLLQAAHCVAVVGFSDDRGAWRIQNSWGTAWGEAGFVWMRYGCCYLETQMIGVEVAVER